MRMTQKKKKCIKKNMLLDIDVSDVFVVKNSRKRAFIEYFNYSSVNFTQKNLGTILGFFIVRNETPLSENIVNFLASEVKKKYFSPIQKPIEEKFESTLRHINRALEEIANVGNVEWLGHIDGAVCAIDEKSIYFSVTGNAHILLLRDQTLMNISEGLASAGAAEYPLKTFVDISNGNLYEGDKIIITSQELLDLISFEELQKNAIRFGQENFIQFIQTVLTNECAIATTTIVDVTCKKQPQLTPFQEPKPIPTNLFDATAFNKKGDEPSLPPTKHLGDKLPQIQDKPKEYTDPRTGHIHIQDEGEEMPQKPSFVLLLQEKSADIYDALKTYTTKTTRSLTKKIPTASKKKEHKNNENYTENSSLSDTTPLPQKAKSTVYKVCTITFNGAKNISIRCVSIIKQRKKPKTDTSATAQQEYVTPSQPQPRKKKSSFLPNFHHMQKLWKNMSTKTRFLTIGIFALIVIIPLIFAMHSPNKQMEDITDTASQPQEESIPAPQPATPITNNTIAAPTQIIANTSTITAIMLNNTPIGITKNTIITLDNKEENDIPNDIGEIALAAPMDDLDLIFFITTKNKLYSFSPVTKKFTEQKNAPSFDYTKIVAINTYMTYLYTLGNDMIMRYTRQENGFDDGKKWLKEPIDLAGATTFAIDSDIYIARNGKVEKFTKGEKTSFAQDPTITNATSIYTTEKSKFMWILDKENATLFKTEKSNGKKIDEYVQEQFSTSTSLAVDEKNNQAFITTQSEILQFNLQ